MQWRENSMGSFTKALGTTATLPLLGISFIFAWAYAPLMAGQEFYLFHHLGFGICLLFTATIAAGKGRLWAWATAHRRSLSVAASFAMVLAPIALVATDQLAPLFIFVGGPLSGAGVAWTFASWFSLYCRFRTELAAAYTLLSFSLSSCLRLALVPLSGALFPALPLVLAALPFLGLACELGADKRDPGDLRLKKTYDTSGDAGDKPPFAGAWGFFVEVAIYGLVFGILRNGITEWSNAAVSLYAGHLIRIVMPLMLLAWLLISPGDERKTAVLRGAVLAGAFLAIAGVFFGDSPTLAISALTLAMRNFVTILLYLMLFRIVRDCEESPVVIFGVGRGIYEVALSGGLALYFATDVSHYIATMPITMFYFVIASLLVLLLSSFGRVCTAIRRVPPAPFVARNAANIDERFVALASRFALSEREVEVARLLCMGRTKRYIAETLFLSEDTVRWHSKQLYRKLDVHSKQELIDLVGLE